MTPPPAAGGYQAPAPRLTHPLQRFRLPATLIKEKKK